MGRPLGSKNKISSLQKFAQYHAVDEATGCWNWTKHVGKNGYGWFRQDGHGHAHRWSYATFRGPIPDGLWVLHSCDNRRCVNPAHLFLGTNRDNARDMAAKGRQWLQDPARRINATPHFRPGHPLMVKISPEARKKAAASNTGKTRSPEQIERMAAAQQKRQQLVKDGLTQPYRWTDEQRAAQGSRIKEWWAARKGSLPC